MNILLVCPHSSELVGAHPSFLPLGVAYIAAVLDKYDDQTFQETVRRDVPPASRRGRLPEAAPTIATSAIKPSLGENTAQSPVFMRARNVRLS